MREIILRQIPHRIVQIAKYLTDYQTTSTNWKEFGRKRSSPNLGTSPAFSSRDWEIREKHSGLQAYRVGFEHGTSLIKCRVLTLRQFALSLISHIIHRPAFTLNPASWDKAISSHPFALTCALREFRRHSVERVATYSQSSGRGLYYVNQIRLLSRIVRCYSTAVASSGRCTENCEYSIGTQKAQFNYGIEEGKLWNSLFLRPCDKCGMELMWFLSFFFKNLLNPWVPYNAENLLTTISFATN
jgi:hypothetical protein